MEKRIHNFSAGPAVLPLTVLKKAQEEFLNFQGLGMSIIEMSHRTKPFETVLFKTEEKMRALLSIPENYAILFLQGGASLQFSMVPMNLAHAEQSIDMINTGVWSQKAIKEAKKVAKVRILASSEQDQFTHIPSILENQLDSNAAYLHITSNNTIYGTQYHQYPNTGDIPLVADMSSDIFSKPFDINQFGLIYAGAQKNIGPSGVTVVIMKKDLAERANTALLPSMLLYKNHIENTSLYNTPNTFGIYMIGLVMDWIEQQGGLSAIQKINQKKANCIYDVIDNGSFYTSPVKKEHRSLMNIVFRIKQNNEELEAKFLAEAKAHGFEGLKGHRLVGGLRASTYNALPLESATALAEFMTAFKEKHK